MSATPLHPCSVCGKPANPDLRLLDGAHLCDDCADSWASSPMALSAHELEKSLQLAWAALRRVELRCDHLRASAPPPPVVPGKPSLAVVPPEPTHE